MDRKVSVVLGGTTCVLAFLGTPHVYAAFQGFSMEGSENTHPRAADGSQEENPFINAYHITGAAIQIDGKLDDKPWSRAQAARGFRMWDPQRGGEVSEETIFKVAYDQDAIYFAVACLEKDMSNVSSNLARRDRFSYSDLVSIYIDPYFDKNTGYNFKVNPQGVKIDSYLSGNGNYNDTNWDAVWEAETSKDDKGWYAEIRIPFSSIRYRPSEDMTWGLQVYRYMHGRGEDTAWKIWDREENGFISHFGELRGLRNIPAPRQLEIMPYALTRSINESTYGPNDNIENNLNLGADIKYGITADLTLNATVLPDFGQVEADPSELNLSPFETRFEEKRPFFIEGNQYFGHPDFSLFYSRRIGTRQDGARIRGAAKLTGKTKDNISLGFLAATTDGKPDERWNLFESGDDPRSFFVGRVGKEFNQGNQEFNLMGTATSYHKRRGSDGRDAYTGGMDFDLFWKNRTYNIQGSSVFSNIVNGENSGVWGTGGNLDIRKVAGVLQGGLWGRWEGDRLELNDVGFLGAPDEMTTGLWLSHQHNPEGTSKWFNRAQSNFNLYRGWLYGARTGYDHATGSEELWSYGKGVPQSVGGNLNGWMQFRNYYESWWGIEHAAEARNRWDTRGGPLMTEPATTGGWWGIGSDYRKPFQLQLKGNYFRDVEDNLSWSASINGRWNMSSTMTHQLGMGFRHRVDDTQYLDSVVLADHPGGRGIGGISYVFGEIDQQTLDITLRSSILFTRDQSLDLYLQPFLTVGDYTNAKELGRPDSYDFVDYDGIIVVGRDEDENDITADPNDRDFSFVSANLNLVYRWEFRLGSTLYLVWAHARETGARRHNNPGEFNSRLNGSKLFSNEPTNTFMTKITYWFNM